jgi:hypothetical protein
VRGAHVRALVVASLLLVASCGPFNAPPTPNRAAQVRAPWVLREMAANGLVVSVRMGGEDCSRFAGIDVVESAQTVEVRAWIDQFRTDGCFLVSVYKRVSVELIAPLGTRPLIGCMIEDSGPHKARKSCAELVPD